MASVKEIAKAAKSKIKSSKKLKEDAIDIIKDKLPVNCSLLLEVLLRSYKFDKDLNDLNDELDELTPDLYFRINTDKAKYEEGIKQLWTKEKPELLTDGIMLCDIYYQRKDLTSKAGFKQLAKESEGTKRIVATTIAEGTFYDNVIIRISAHPPGKIDVNNIVNHLNYFHEIDKKVLIELLSKTTFNWKIFSLGGIVGSKPEKKINKFKNYKDMIENLTKFLVEDVSKEGGVIKKYFEKGLFASVAGLVNEILGGFSKKEINFAQPVIFFDTDGTVREI